MFEGPRDNPHRWVDLSTTKTYGVHISLDQPLECVHIFITVVFTISKISISPNKFNLVFVFFKYDYKN